MGYKEDAFREYEYKYDAFEEEYGRAPNQAESIELWREAEGIAEEVREARADMLRDSDEYRAWRKKQGEQNANP